MAELIMEDDGFGLSVNETILTRELEYARREIASLKHHMNIFDQESTKMFADRPLDAVMTMPDNMTELLPIIRWRVETNAMYGTQVIGNTYEHTTTSGRRTSPDVHFAYYVSDPEMYSRNRRVDLLGHLHKKVIKSLSKFLEDNPK